MSPNPPGARDSDRVMSCDMERLLNAAATIRTRLEAQGGTAEIDMQRGGTFHVHLRRGGVDVDNLGTSPFLPWPVFDAVIELLRREGGSARRGDAMNHRLGEAELSMNSIEGYVAKAVFGTQPGETVFRRITPVTCILVWAGLCRHTRGGLALVSSKNS